MTVGTTNSEEMCQIAVSQAMKHMRPDQESELLSVEETFPTEATQGEVPAPGIISVITSRIPCNEEKREQAVSKGLRTTINTPDAINNDKLRYLYPHNDSEASGSQHTPGQCACADCVSQQEALMQWALMAAQQQHTSAIAEATAAAEAAQRRGEGPKPMMVTPYKHNWVIAENASEEEATWFDWGGIATDFFGLWSKDQVHDRCCDTPTRRVRQLLNI